jgi:PIN domain nuclease of toxin-antitoxin system
VKLLLETPIVLWAVAEPELLFEPARVAIADDRNSVAFSAGSVWEIAIKSAAGRLEVPADFVQLLLDRQYSPLPITPSTRWRREGCPPHHADPFDRMLIAQAQIEELTLVTRDEAFAAYNVPVLPA